MKYRFERYCKDYENIENYEKALADNFKNWEVHHRLETHNSDGERRLVDITADELLALGMYWYRPASELIFLTRSEHRHLHFACKGYRRGHIPWNKGKTGYSSKPHKKYKWMTPDGSIVEMVKNLAKMHHPDWKLIE